MSGLFQIITAQELKSKIAILAAFDSVSTLKDMHSLCECDFYDTNHFYSEQGIDCSQNVSSLSAEELIPSYVLGNDRKNLIFQLNSRSVLVKSYHWKTVDYRYMSNYLFGFSHLTKVELQFYFAAWVYVLCFSDSEVLTDEKMTRVSERFFGELLLFNKSRLRPSLNQEQVNAIVDCLLLVYMRNADFLFQAKSCLFGGWLELAPDKKSVLDMYIQEKEIQDFIDKG